MAPLSPLVTMPVFPSITHHNHEFEHEITCNCMLFYKVSMRWPEAIKFQWEIYMFMNHLTIEV